jgi:hypothetical protein
MNERQFDAMKVGLTRDATSQPAPLEFGVWTAQFRSASEEEVTDVVAVTTRGEIAAALIADTAGTQGFRLDATGQVTLSALPGRYALLVNARHADSLGRQSLGLTVRSFGHRPGVSDLLVAIPWSDDVVSRVAMLEHVAHDLTFRTGESVRVFAEVYGLTDNQGRAAYHATYRLLKTDNPTRDIAREDWQRLGAQTFEFDRAGPRDGSSQVETIVVEPRYLPPGTYLLRLEVRDNVAGATLGRSTIALIVR